MNHWDLIAHPLPLHAAEGFSEDLALLEGVSQRVRPQTLRVWQTVQQGVVRSCRRTSGQCDPGVIAQRCTPGADWIVSGTHSILWSIASLQRYRDERFPDLICEWPLTSLRLTGLQASAHEDGSLRTPLGTIGFWGVVVRDGAALVQGIVNYGAPGGEQGWPSGSENVRGQSGLPLPLVLDRFSRTARTLFRAREADL